jgi:hypothetical protein
MAQKVKISRYVVCDDARLGTKGKEALKYNITFNQQ